MFIQSGSTHSLSSVKEPFIMDDPKYIQQIFRLGQCVTMSPEQGMLAEVLKA